MTLGKRTGVGGIGKVKSRLWTFLYPRFYPFLGVPFSISPIPPDPESLRSFRFEIISA